ncbi:hypothetical protein Neosp_007592 [[Neocosmospora] mangrovei]
MAPLLQGTPDRNEEPTFVTYVVPGISEWKRWLEAQNHEDIEDEGMEMGPTVVYLKRFRHMQAEMQDHLKSRRPAHSVPSIYIMLKKLPPNPNAKSPGSVAPLNIRKSLGADITIGVLYANPSHRGLGSQVDRLRSGQAVTVDKAIDTAYAESFEEVINTLDDKYQSGDPDALSPSSGAKFFLTGAIGFLGTYLVKEIMGREITELIANFMSEQLVWEAGKRGLRGAVVRPGYILGSRENVVIASALNPRPGVNAVHVTAHPRLRMNEFLSLLEYYGYNVSEVDYEEWKTRLEEFVSAGSTKKDQENAVTVLKADADRWTGVDDSAGEGITREDVGRYLCFLAEINFIPLTTRRGRELPPIAAEIAQA